MRREGEGGVLFRRLALVVFRATFTHSATPVLGSPDCLLLSFGFLVFLCRGVVVVVMVVERRVVSLGCAQPVFSPPPLPTPVGFIGHFIISSHPSHPFYFVSMLRSFLCSSLYSFL